MNNLMTIMMMGHITAQYALQLVMYCSLGSASAIRLANKLAREGGNVSEDTMKQLANDVRNDVGAKEFDKVSRSPFARIVARLLTSTYHIPMRGVGLTNSSFDPSKPYPSVRNDEESAVVATPRIVEVSDESDSAEGIAPIAEPSTSLPLKKINRASTLA